MRRIAILVIVLASCTRSVPPPKDTSTPVPTDPPRSATPTPANATPPVAAPIARPTTGTLVLTLSDPRGKHPANIPVQISGPQSMTKQTDGNGQLKQTLEAGNYTLTIAKGCSARANVTSPASAQVGIPAGGTIDAPLTIDWQRNPAPSKGAEPNPGSPFAQGVTVTVRFPALDRCTSSPMPNASLEGWTFKPGQNVRVVGSSSPTTDAQGYGTVQMQCVAEGRAELYAADSTNLDDNVDVLLGAGPQGAPANCA